MRPDTLTRLVEAATSRPDAGALGSLVLNADEPSEAEFRGTVVDPVGGFPCRTFGGRRRGASVSGAL